MSNEDIDLVEMGKRLEVVRNQPVWQDILDLMEARVKDAEYDLMNCRSENAVHGFHLRAYTLREFFHKWQMDVESIITESQSQRIAAQEREI